MKTTFFNIISILFSLLFISLGLNSCEPPATVFDDVEDAFYYSRSEPVAVPPIDSSVRVMTWNMRFGIGRGEWFGDACGDKVIYSKDEILVKLQLIVDKINEVNPDILLLQEVDINSKRSGYIDQLRWILDRTSFNYAVYGYQWQSQFIPSDGLGRLQEANAILSRWPIKDATRIQLPLRQDQGALTRYFYERCCMVNARIDIPGVANFYAVNIHASAFATDDTKHQHIIDFKSELDNIVAGGGWFVAGGDLNTLPPGSDSTDFCIEDMCPGESFHQPGDDPQHKDGSDYTPESQWLDDLYNTYQCAVELAEYQQNQQAYFSHTTRPGHFWDRTLDYMFTNSRWQKGTTITHQDFLTDSDHAPVSSNVILKKKYLAAINSIQYF
jgi:endonuclease/exonuclease/phosphatase family metal-dependent hydrolase